MWAWLFLHKHALLQNGALHLSAARLGRKSDVALYTECKHNVVYSCFGVPRLPRHGLHKQKTFLFSHANPGVNNTL